MGCEKPQIALFIQQGNCKYDDCSIFFIAKGQSFCKGENKKLRKKLLFMVWFSGILYYKKDQGYRTNDTTGLYYVFSHKGDDNSHDIHKGGINSNHNPLLSIDYENLFTILHNQQGSINAIYKVAEIYGLDQGESSCFTIGRRNLNQSIYKE